MAIKDDKHQGDPYAPTKQDAVFTSRSSRNTSELSSIDGEILGDHDVNMATSETPQQEGQTEQSAAVAPMIIPAKDPTGVYSRRLDKYRTFDTSGEHLTQHLHPINESLFGEQPHNDIIIKTVCTIKCDICRERCRPRSEVYQCKTCVFQICRECVEDRLQKEKSGKPQDKFTWRAKSTGDGDRHEAFKAAYLHRKEKQSGKGDVVFEYDDEIRGEVYEVRMWHDGKATGAGGGGGRRRKTTSAGGPGEERYATDSEEDNTPSKKPRLTRHRTGTTAKNEETIDPVEEALGSKSETLNKLKQMKSQASQQAESSGTTTTTPATSRAPSRPNTRAVLFNGVPSTTIVRNRNGVLQSTIDRHERNDERAEAADTEGPRRMASGPGALPTQPEIPGPRNRSIQDKHAEMAFHVLGHVPFLNYPVFDPAQRRRGTTTAATRPSTASSDDSGVTFGPQFKVPTVDNKRPSSKAIAEAGKEHKAAAYKLAAQKAATEKASKDKAAASQSSTAVPTTNRPVAPLRRAAPSRIQHNRDRQEQETRAQMQRSMPPQSYGPVHPSPTSYNDPRFYSSMGPGGPYHPDQAPMYHPQMQGQYGRPYGHYGQHEPSSQYTGYMPTSYAPPNYPSPDQNPMRNPRFSTPPTQRDPVDLRPRHRADPYNTPMQPYHFLAPYQHPTFLPPRYGGPINSSEWNMHVPTSGLPDINGRYGIDIRGNDLIVQREEYAVDRDASRRHVRAQAQGAQQDVVMLSDESDGGDARGRAAPVVGRRRPTTSTVATKREEDTSTASSPPIDPALRGIPGGDAPPPTTLFSTLLTPNDFNRVRRNLGRGRDVEDAGVAKADEVDTKGKGKGRRYSF